MSNTSAWPDLTRLTGVSEAVEEARSAIAELRRHPANRRGWPKSAAAAGVRAARASAALDGGSQILDRDAEAITDPVLAGSMRCHAAVVSLAPVWERAPLQALARLHTLAAADLEHESALGRPRGSGIGPDPLPGTGSGSDPGPVPAADDRIAGRLAALATLVTHAPWPAPVITAIVHAEVLTLQPFRSANGVIARAAARLTMISSGLDSQSLSVPEVGHLRREKRYRECAIGYATGDPAAVAEWIVHVCDALAAGAREGRSIADAIGAEG
ncbi:oxidoreductase [Nakamurella silvestris]|nr:oxidoreductase [Nakamurella silvestris]